MIMILVLVLLASFGSAEPMYIVDVGFVASENIFIFSGVTLGDITSDSQTGPYRAQLLDSSGSVLYERRFDVSGDHVTLFLPYSAAGAEIVFLKETELLRFSVIQFAQTCGNSICELHELGETCPEDCPLTEPIPELICIRDSVCDTACAEETPDPDCIQEPQKLPEESVPVPITVEPPSSRGGFLILVLLALLLGGVIAVIVVVSRMRIAHRSYDKELHEYLVSYVLNNLGQGYTLEQIQQMLSQYYDPRVVTIVLRNVAEQRSR